MATTDIYHVVGALSPARKAVRFLGGAVDDGIQIDAFAAARVAANDATGTFTAWIMVPDITGNYCIFGAGDANAVDYIYFDVNAGKIHAQAARAGPDVAFNFVTTNIVLKAHTWHHVAIVQDAQFPKIYVDGVEAAVTKTDATEAGYWFDTIANIDGAHIGAADSIAGDAALTLEYKGYISDFKYWNTALTASQVEDDYKGVTNTTSLVLHLDMDDDYVDSGSGATNGTAVGDIVLTNAASEFSSRMSFMTGTPVVADKVLFSINENQGHAVVIQAA